MSVDVDVTRTDYVRRSKVHLRCSGCGTTTVWVPIEEAVIYEEGWREHVCYPVAEDDVLPRPAFRRLLVHMMGTPPSAAEERRADGSVSVVNNDTGARYYAPPPDPDAPPPEPLGAGWKNVGHTTDGGLFEH